MTVSNQHDYVIVGGGLQGCLVAHALVHHRPSASVLLLERADSLCGNHTWSFHGSDVPAAAKPWLEPLVSKRWERYSVSFPGYRRRVELPYATITSDDLRSSTRTLSDRQKSDGDRVPLSIRCGVACDVRSGSEVQLATGERVSGVVLDCRGMAATGRRQTGAGYQTFIGREYQTERRWPSSEPTVMDVRPDQEDGFEFLYELPFGPHRVLLEYTRFSREPACDDDRATRFIEARLGEAGVDSAEVVRTERGCLPMPYESGRTVGGAAVAGGYAGAWYHAATGYSMPLAIRFAETVAKADPRRVAEEIARAAAVDRPRRAFARFLNRMLFCLVRPEHRWKVFRRFYRVLPEERIARFYGHRFTAADAARIVIGRPPSGLAPLRFFRSLISHREQAPS
ncbi:MAG: lycopene beta-cyclase CrtY [Planctomycetota bacterium]